MDFFESEGFKPQRQEKEKTREDEAYAAFRNVRGPSEPAVNSVTAGMPAEKLRKYVKYHMKKRKYKLRMRSKCEQYCVYE